MKATKAEIQERREKALTIISLRPGITEEAIAAHIGVPLRERTSEGRLITNRSLKSFVEGLRGLVWILEPDALHASRRLHPYGPIPTKPTFQPSKPKGLGECRTFTIPLSELHRYTTSATPVRSPIADIPTATEWMPKKPSIATPAKESPMRRPEENRQRVEAEIKKMIADGKPLTRHQICKRAGVGVNYFNSNSAMQERWEQAIAQLKSATETQSVADLPDSPTNQLDLIATLKQEAQHWRATLKRIEAEEQQLQEDKKSAIANLWACERLIATREGEKAPELEMVYSVNGNGKAIVGGQS